MLMLDCIERQHEADWSHFEFKSDHLTDLRSKIYLKIC